MKRKPRIRVSRRRGLASPDDLAKAMTQYLLGRTNTIPTVYTPKEAK